jgi:hypothetical protein
MDHLCNNAQLISSILQFSNLKQFDPKFQLHHKQLQDNAKRFSIFSLLRNYYVSNLLSTTLLKNGPNPVSK